MIDRLINALAWVSLGFAILVFIISYANFPEEVLVYIESTGAPILYVPKDTLFYLFLLVAILFNGGWLALKGVVNRTTPEYTQTVISLSVVQIFSNLFMATAIYFVNLLNSRENLDYSNFGLFIYVTGGLLIASLIFTLFTRFVLKK